MLFKQCSVRIVPNFVLLIAAAPSAFLILAVLIIFLFFVV